MGENQNIILWPQFEAVDMRAGTILHAEPLAKAKKPAYKLSIDFGPLGIMESSAQITVLYKPAQLPGMQVIAVVNFAPKIIAGFKSECLVLGVYNSDGDVVLLQPQQPVRNGDKVG
jgi:tRNA-binding protein